MANYYTRFITTMGFRKVLNSLFIVFSLSISAQYEEMAKFKQTYPDDDYIYLERSHFAKITNKKDELAVSCNTHESFLYLSEKSIRYNERSVASNNLTPIVKMEAKLYNPEKEKYKSERIKDVSVRTQPSRLSFYDDQKIHTIAFNNLRPLSYYDLDYTIEYKQPRFFSMFYVDDDYHTEKFMLEIECDNSVKLAVEYFNCKASEFQISEEVKGRQTIYRWTKSNLKKIEVLPGNLNFRYYAAAIGVRISEFTNTNGQNENYLKTPGDLYNWYYSITSPVSDKDYASIKKVGDSLCKNINDTLQKMKAIFNYVQDNVSYVAFEDDMGGFIPRTPESVCSKRIGDCKDMATLIYNLGRSQGLPCYLTWIGTRDIPYTYEKNPTTFSDNHMISTFIYKNNYYYMDATGKNAPFELFTSMIQGKQALIGKGEKNFEIKTVPTQDASVSYIKDTVRLTVKQDGIKGKRKALFGGYEKTQLQYASSRGNANAEAYSYLHDKLLIGNNKTKYTTKTVPEVAKEMPLALEEDINLVDYASTIKNELVFNPIVAKNLLEGLPEGDYKKDMEVDYKYIHDFYYHIKLENNFQLSEVPQDKSFGNENFKYYIKYKKVNAAEIICQFNLEINTLVLSSNMNADWKKFSRRLIEDAGESLLLKKQ
jgi:hypothetical protein